MAHGERHTAIAKQIQEHIENCLKTLHSNSAASCERGIWWSWTFSQSCSGFSWMVGRGQISFSRVKVSALMPRWCPDHCYTMYSGPHCGTQEILFPGLGCRWVEAAKEEAGAVSDGEEVVSACGQPSCRFYTCTAQEKTTYVRISLKISLISMHFNASLTSHHMPFLLTWSRGDLWPDAGCGVTGQCPPKAASGPWLA